MVVESSVGGSCRCPCQEDLQEEEGGGASCCSPQVFTSVLLGILACVLMTGGVFLAFHRWDPLWLIVSGIGVVLILIGSVLHCCTLQESKGSLRGRHPASSSGGKVGCCGGRHAEHGHHLVVNNGSLTEQLLPLSNARSVSQLSLNMLPGYFPPVVTTYGIEQHSAVVQNINRIVQQQQSPGSSSPGVQSAAGKSFILLSLPADTTQQNLQNLVATVYQMDESPVVEPPSADMASSPPPTITPAPPPNPLFKNAEVQTCWPTSSIQQNGAGPSTELTSAEHLHPSSSIAMQTDDGPDVNLMDCLDVPTPSICDNAPETNIPTSSVSTELVVAIPQDSVATDVLVDIDLSVNIDPDVGIHSAFSNILDINPSSDVLVDIDPASSDVRVAVDSLSSDVLVSIDPASSDVLSNIDPASSDIRVDIDPPSDVVVSIASDVRVGINPASSDVLVEDAATSETDDQIEVDVPTSSVDTNCGAQDEVVTVVSSQGLGVSSELSLSSSNLSEEDVDDSELMARSSPPPSYDDATHESAAIGAFGLAYGTI